MTAQTGARPSRTRNRTAAAALCAAAALALGALGPRAAVAQDATPRVVAIGDVHGAYDELVALLRRAELVDARLAWSGGDTRLVVLGDVLDRGAGSRQALELIMRLHDEAARAGGEAQLVLGNHEVMNLIGELSYVTPAEYAAYVADEPAEQRAAAWERFVAARAARGDASALAAEFATLYPPGFFGHRAAFAARGRFGAWLLERPVIATVGRTAFVHGGLPASIAGQDAAAVNRGYSAALRDYFAAVATLTDAGILAPEMSFGEQIGRAAQLASAAPADVREAAGRLQALAGPPLYGDDTVFWYRGTAACSAAIEEDRLTAVLRTLGVDRVVIGHTPTSTRQVQSRFGGAVLRADTGMLASSFHGRPSAVVLRGAAASVLYADSSGMFPPVPQPRQVGRTSPDIDDDALERLLAEAPVLSRSAVGGGVERIVLDGGGTRVTALFKPIRRGAVSLPDVAAYRLDRLLEADLVPVAVRREIDGRVGALRLDDQRLPDDRARRARPDSANAWCPLRDQFALMYAFDALTHNNDRKPETVRYVPDGWRLTLGDNAAAFGTAVDLPDYLRPVLQVSPALAARLGTLSAEALERRLGDVLDARQRAAVLARRDRLTALTATAPR